MSMIAWMPALLAVLPLMLKTIATRTMITTNGGMTMMIGGNPKVQAAAWMPGFLPVLPQLLAAAWMPGFPPALPLLPAILRVRPTQVLP